MTSKRLWFLISFVSAAVLNPRPLQAGAVAELLVDGTNGGTVVAGLPSAWEFRFYYMSTGEPVTDFEPLHTKYMHMFVISQDLKEFSHLHPILDQNDHVFRLTINSQPIDGDNFSQKRVIERSGEYFVISEVKIKDTVHETQGLYFVDGREGPAMDSLPEVEISCNGTPLLRHMDREGSVQVQPSFYRIEVSCKPIVIGDFPTVEFQYKWQMLKHGSYAAVTDFTHWLHMTGHAMAVSLSGDSVGAKVFRHMHNMAPMGSSLPLTFKVDQQHGGMPDGAYKVWAQFKRDNRVLTLPVVVDFRN